MSYWLALVLPFAAGAGIALQPLINNRLGGALASVPWAAAASGVVAMAGLVLMALASGQAVPPTSAWARTTWWMYTGGLLGGFIVVASMLAVPKTGTLLLVALIITGQMLTALAADQFGLFGGVLREASWQRVVGSALLLGGAVMIQRG